MSKHPTDQSIEVNDDNATSDRFTDNSDMQHNQRAHDRDMSPSVMRLYFNIRDGDGRAEQILGENNLLE